MTELPRKYQQHPIESKREIVEASLRPGVSVAVLARTHGINANQIWAWRKLYKEGRLGAATPDRRTTGTLPALMAVDVINEPAEPASSERLCGKLEITIGRARICVEGMVDPTLLRTALTALMA